MTTEDSQLRLRALELAVQTGADVLKDAQAFYNFLVFGSPKTVAAPNTADVHERTEAPLEQAKPEPAKRGRPPKAQTETLLVEEPAPGPEGPPVETALTYADVQKAVVNCAKVKGAATVREVFAKFDVDHATKLKEDQWASCIAALDEAAG